MRVTTVALACMEARNRSAARARAGGRYRWNLPRGAGGRAAAGHAAPRRGRGGGAFDDSIITDTTVEKRQDMDEAAAGLMEPWEYRAKWYGEDEQTAKGLAPLN